MMQFINIGFGNMAAAHKIIAIVTPEGAPVKRGIQEARENNLLIDATHGRKTRSVIYLESGQLILSALQPETIISRTDNIEGQNKEA